MISHFHVPANLLCISRCCPQYFCDVYPLHHSHFGASCWARCLFTSLLSSSVFIHVLPRCHSGSARIFTFLLRCPIALYWIAQEFQFSLRVQGNNFICFHFLCCILCAAALSWYCLCDISLGTFCAEFWQPIPVSFLSKFSSVLPIILFILAITWCYATTISITCDIISWLWLISSFWIGFHNLWYY